MAAGKYRFQKKPFGTKVTDIIREPKHNSPGTTPRLRRAYKTGPAEEARRKKVRIKSPSKVLHRDR